MITEKVVPGLNNDSVGMEELVGGEDLLESYQFNFSVDLEYFLTFFHPRFSKDRRKLVFITGSPILSQHENRRLIESKFNIHEAVAPLPNKFASHHTKMMINFFTSGEAEVVILTSNLTQIDFGGLSQALWRSGRLATGNTSETLGKRFRFDLLRYLSKYGLNVTRTLVNRLARFNFDFINVELVASAPGTYDLSSVSENGEMYGYGKLRQVLERNNLLIENTEAKHNILAQVTSIAYPYKSQKGATSSVFSHLLCPLAFKDWKELDPGGSSFEHHQLEFNYEPQIVFPTMKNIAESVLGFLSGSAVHFKYSDSPTHKKQYEQNIKRYLCAWNGGTDISGREKITPHNKFYACDNADDWKSFKWVMMGSHNLSKQAWGYPVSKGNGKMFEISSYELSVLVPSTNRQLVPVYKGDTTDKPGCSPIRLPFAIPPQRYDNSDVPWSPSASGQGLVDAWGNSHIG